MKYIVLVTFIISLTGCSKLPKECEETFSKLSTAFEEKKKIASGKNDSWLVSYIENGQKNLEAAKKELKGKTESEQLLTCRQLAASLGEAKPPQAEATTPQQQDVNKSAAAAEVTINGVVDAGAMQGNIVTSNKTYSFDINSKEGSMVLAACKVGDSCSVVGAVSGDDVLLSVKSVIKR